MVVRSISAGEWRALETRAREARTAATALRVNGWELRGYSFHEELREMMREPALYGRAGAEPDRGDSR